MARAVLPLHSKNPVADLQSAHRIQAEPAVERSTDQLTCCGKLGGEATSNQQDISDWQGRRGSGCMVWLEWERPHLKSQIPSSFGGTSSHVLAKAPVSVQDSHRGSARIGYAHCLEDSCEIR